MKNLGHFRPNEVSAHPSPDGELLGLRFQSETEYVDLTFDRTSVAPLLERVLADARIETQPVAGSDLDGLVKIEAHSVSNIGPEVALGLHLRSDDGMRDMTWRMSPLDACELARQLTEHAAKAGGIRPS